MEAENELIAKFMGLPFKTVVTVYNYGMDFRHSYDEEVIYSNKKPKLVKYEEKFVNQLVATYDNYFDSDNQEDDFEYKSYLSYYSTWDELMPVIEKILNICAENDELERYSIITDNVTYLAQTYEEVVEFIKNYYEI